MTTRGSTHFDVCTVDSDEIVLGLGAVPGGLTSWQVRRHVRYVSAAADVVGLTIAEFFPRQVMHLQQILDGFPLSRTADPPHQLSEQMRAAASEFVGATTKAPP